MARVKMSTVWDSATEFLRDSGFTLLPLVVALIAIPTALAGVLTAMANVPGTGGANGMRLAIIVLALVCVWGQLAVAALATGVSTAAQPAVRLALGRLPKFILASLILGIALFVALVPAGLAIFWSGVDMAMLGSNDPAAVALAMRSVPRGIFWFALLYSLIVIFAFFWMVARMNLLLPVIAGGSRIFGAFGRSFALTRGLALKIFGMLLLLSVVSNVAQLAAKAVFGSVFALLGAGTEPLALGSLATTLLVAVIGAGFAVVSTVFSSKLYLAVRGDAATDAQMA